MSAPLLRASPTCSILGLGRRTVILAMQRITLLIPCQPTGRELAGRKRNQAGGKGMRIGTGPVFAYERIVAAHVVGNVYAGAFVPGGRAPLPPWP